MEKDSENKEEIMQNKIIANYSYMMRRNLIIVILAVFVLISGCEYLKAGTKVSIDELLSAPEEIEIANRRYVLEADLWRDFMPISPPDGKPLISQIWVTATDLLEFPQSIDADRIWVVNGRDVWEAGFSDEERPQYLSRKHQLNKVARKGPKWGPGIKVDVVVRVIDGKNNTYLIRSSDRSIHRTD